MAFNSRFDDGEHKILTKSPNSSDKYRVPSIIAVSESLDSSQVAFTFLNLNSSPKLHFDQCHSEQCVRKICKTILFFDIEIVVIPENLSRSLATQIKTKCSNVKIIPQTMISPPNKIAEFCKDQILPRMQSIGHKQDIQLILLSLTELYNFFKRNSIIISLVKLEFDFCYATNKLSLDIETAVKIELINKYSKAKSTPQETLLSKIDTCVTEMGKYALKLDLLEPSTSVQDIIMRQNTIKELMNHSDTMKEAKECLENLKNMQNLINLSCLIFNEPKGKTSQAILKLLTILISTLKNIKDLAQILSPLTSQQIQNLRQKLNQPAVNLLFSNLSDILRSNSNETELRNEEKKVFVIQDGVNKFLDTLKLNYSTNIAKARSLVEQYSLENQNNYQLLYSKNKGFHMKIKTKLFKKSSSTDELHVLHRTNTYIYLTSSKLCEINKTVDAIYGEIQIVNNVILMKLYENVQDYLKKIYLLVEVIGEIDVLIALSEFCKPDWCFPHFDIETVVIGASHPLTKTDYNQIKQHDFVLSVEKNMCLVYGKNMCGKTTYIKTILLLQVLAQCGLSIPATKAHFRICDKILARFGFDDDVEGHCSSFMKEMLEIECLMRNITIDSLIVIDDLCRNTNPIMSKIFSWSICEKFLRILDFKTDVVYEPKENRHRFIQMKLSKLKRPFFVISTHLEHLLHITNKYYNVNKITMTVGGNLANTNDTVDLQLGKAFNFPARLIDYVNIVRAEVKKMAPRTNSMDSSILVEKKLRQRNLYELNFETSLQIPCFTLYELSSILSKYLRRCLQCSEQEKQILKIELVKAFSQFQS